ncbi:hypothetical protein [Occallatibacter riparius]|uniref:Uncharacterized protein n=1 Tax=Occallatibacter riparius TaxID=1002689 RepID=A0A9J7BWH6_9BACT|nr:hypothetical protein [Occallatibacter riparius]UWZ85230.1 hypothetical protein MOP44_04630 [Occallatibacter riparius]
MIHKDRSQLLVVGPATFMNSPAARSLRRLNVDIVYVEDITIDFLLKGADPEVAIVYSDRPDARMSAAISELQCWSSTIRVVVITRELPPEWPTASSQVDLDLEMATRELVPLIRFLLVLSRSRFPKPAGAVQLGSGYGRVEPGVHIAYLGAHPGDWQFPAQFIAATEAHEAALILGPTSKNKALLTKLKLMVPEADRPIREGTISAVSANNMDITTLTAILQKIIAARDVGSSIVRILTTCGDSSVDHASGQVRLAERLWTRVCSEIPAVLVCAFGVAPPQGFDCAIKTHPFVIMGERLIRNPLCIF